MVVLERWNLALWSAWRLMNMHSDIGFVGISKVYLRHRMIFFNESVSFEPVKSWDGSLQVTHPQSPKFGLPKRL